MSDAAKLQAKLHRCLGSEARLNILVVLQKGPQRVVDLAGETNLSVSRASAELQTLASAGLVDFTQNGSSRAYFLVEPLHPIVEATLAQMAVSCP